MNFDPKQPFAPPVFPGPDNVISEDGFPIGGQHWNEVKDTIARTGNRGRYVQTVRTEMGDKMEYDKRGIYAVWQVDPGQEKRLDYFSNQEVAGGPGFYYYVRSEGKYIHTHDEIPPSGIRPKKNPVKREPL